MTILLQSLFLNYYLQDLLIVFQHYGPHIHEYLDPGSEFDREKYETMIDTAFDECAEYQTFINIRWAYGKKVVSSAAQKQT